MEATDEVDGGRARPEVGRPRRRADGRRRDPVEPVELVLDVTDDRTDDEPGALTLLPLAHVPAVNHSDTACCDVTHIISRPALPVHFLTF